MRYVMWGVAILGFVVFIWTAAINFHGREMIVPVSIVIAVLWIAAFGWMAEVLSRLDKIQDLLKRRPAEKE